ncbi:MAG TPA: peptide ABC transporter substrate-binding protein [Candidatus Saccharimonadales bacterium]|nr:peptide ABC transporter substrate-binding protein [Candidatus Saccharimonadales bacterium]
MANEKRGWKQFQKLTFDSKKISKRVKKAEGATMRHAHKFIVGRLDNMRDVRRHIIGWLLLIGVMIVVVGVQLMWFQHSYQTTTAASGGSYAEASLGPIETLNPLYATSSAEVAASRLLFSSLYSYDETGHLRGDLAKSTEVDKSGAKYTITLRSDAVWHDGRQVTANDVAFTVNLIKNPATRSPLRSNWQDVRVEALDDTTVQFQLPASYAPFAHALTFSILPEHVLRNVEPSTIRENNFSRAPIGSGPFSFRLLQTVDVSKHRVVNLTAFEDYYKGAPMINRFEVHAYDTQESIVKALRSGQVSAAADLSAVNAMQVNSDTYNVVSRPINGGVYALLNVDSPILKDKEVRQALQLVTDTEAIRDNLAIEAPPLDSPFIQGQLTGDVPHPPAQNRKKAASLLDSAGWKLVDGVRKNKDGDTLTLTVATTKNTLYEKTLEALAGQWRQLGITVTADIVDTSDPSSNFLQNTLQPRSYDVLLYELSIGADPDVYAYWHSSQAGLNGYNFSNYRNDTADGALAGARARLEPALRNVKYQAFAEQWLKDVPAIGLYQNVAVYVVNKQVRSVDSDSRLISQYDRYADILYWSVNEEQVYKTP